MVLGDSLEDNGHQPIEVNPADLAQKLGVGPGTVRQAIKRLARFQHLDALGSIRGQDTYQLRRTVNPPTGSAWRKWMGEGAAEG